MRVTSRTVCPGWPLGDLGGRGERLLIVRVEEGKPRYKWRIVVGCNIGGIGIIRLQRKAAPGQHRCWQQLLAQARQVDMAKSIDHFGSNRVPPLWARPLWAGTIQDMGNNRVVEEEEEEEERKIY